MKTKDSILKLKKALREEKQRADTNYVAYDRIRTKYTDLVLRMRQVRGDVRRVHTSVQDIKTRLSILDKEPV